MSGSNSPLPRFHATGMGASELGKVRSINEDAHYVSNAAQVYAVADGMGGLPFGEKASECAVRALENRVEALIEGRTELLALIADINRAVWQLGRFISPRMGIGTTMTILVNRGEFCEIAHVGDSAAYWISEGSLLRLTPEQSEKFAFSNSAAAKEPAVLFRTELSQYLGRGEQISPAVFCFRPSAGDRIILCSDGLTAALDLDELWQVCDVHRSRERLAEALLKIALIRGGVDNVTAIVVDIEVQGV